MLSISLLSYSLIAVVSIVFGLIYLIRPQFMPYHGVALAKSWSEVEPNIQTLILALMRVSGGGFVATGITIIILLAIPFQAEEQWAIYAIPLISLCNSLGSFYATSLVKTRTPANPPVKLSLISIFLTIIGFIFSVI